MNNYSSGEFTEAKKWISKKITEGYGWDDVKTFCTTEDKVEEVFIYLKEEELIIPNNLELKDWGSFVDEIKKSYSIISDPYGLSNDNNSSTLPIPTSENSPWTQYKKYLLGQKDGIQKINDEAVLQIEKNSHWILNHMLRDTRTAGPRKGLVMGSVQSGKTANMIGLVTMAAHYDWNFIIVLSGSIDNLRIQTRDRFMNDLISSGGVSWHILEKTSNPDYMIDINNSQRYLIDDLELNLYQSESGSHIAKGFNRYVTVCLKNSTRLKNLISWLHANAAKAARLRILVIDDEADQASINTRRMDINETDEELIERTAVNQLIIDLVNGKDVDGSTTSAPFQAMNYISYTATPYANVLNEAYESSLYPKDFICSLPESKEYFGAKVIFGSAEDETYPGLNIVRDVPKEEIDWLKEVHTGRSFSLPKELKKSICWFLCSAAILRKQEYKKPISMLIHTTALQNGHFEEYEAIKAWLKHEATTGDIVQLCANVYNSEINEFTKEDLKECYPDYSLIDEVGESFPLFEEIEADVKTLASNVVNIMMGEDKEQVYSDDSIHLCVDNCKANRMAEEGTYLRIVYPSSNQLKAMKKAPVFIVMGGNTLSRGLTIEGLVCTYFGRNSNQADSLMQMARWFGYRKGYELLQRIWMPESVQEKYELLEKIDEKLKLVFEDYMLRGKSPIQFGPKIITTATIARFLISSKNKTQNAVECDFDFSGDSYETTKFEDDNRLADNISVTNSFLLELGKSEKSETSSSAYIWYDVDYSIIEKQFLSDDKYHIYDCSSLSDHIPVFREWMKKMNQEGRYLKWNVAIAGDSKAESFWEIGGAKVGKIERSKKTKPMYVDIGSLRSGSDALCDVKISLLNDEQKKLYSSLAETRKSLIENRGNLGLSDVPLLLLYRIDKNLGKKSKAGLKAELKTNEDIIGFSIIVSGEQSGKTHAQSITIRIPESVN